MIRKSPLHGVNWFSAGELRFESYFSGRYSVSLKAAPAEGVYGFVFAGQGAAHPGMFRDQWRRPEIRTLYGRADALAARLGLPSISAHVHATEGHEPVQNLSLFTLEVALFDSLLCRGLVPKALTAHSFGEYAMLVAAGCVSFEEMFEVVAYREAISPPANERGYLVAVGADRERTGQALQGRSYFYSNFNSATQTVVSVAPADLEATVACLKEKGLRAKTLPTPQPYHSPLLQSLKPLMRKFLRARAWSWRPPVTPFFSSVLRRWVRADGFKPEDLLFILENQLVEQVDFITQVRSLGCGRFIEIGPTALLSGFVKENVPGADTQWVGEILRKGERKKAPKAKVKSGVLTLVNEVIGKITGYQIEDISLEDRFQEDLGIDSIKKTEILFTVMERLNYRPEGEVNYARFSQIKDLVGFLESEAPASVAAVEKRVPRFGRYRLGWRPKALEVPWGVTGPEPSPLLIPVHAEEALAWEGDPAGAVEEAIRQIRECGTRQVVLVLSDFTSDISQIAEGSLGLWAESWLPRAVAVVRGVLAADPALAGLSLTLVTVGEGSCLTEGFSSFFKSLRKELPGLRYKHVHLADSTPNVEALKWIRDELRDPTECEVRYRGGQRYVPRLEEIPAGELNGPPEPPSVVVAVGGARGIGVELIDALAASGRGTYYLCGRSSETEVGPSIDRLKARGIEVYYTCLDATDGPAITFFFDAILQKHGRIDLLLHAAGIEISRSLATKSDEEIRTELASKVLSASHVIRAVAANPPTRILFFSSVVAWYGNAGQTVYALSNGVLDRLARELNRAWGEGTASSLLWPPWDGVGMTANPVIRQSLEAKGLSLLPVTEAKKLWEHDWPFARTGAEERIFYFDPADDGAYGMPLRSGFAPLLGELSLGRGLFRFSREITLQGDPYLADHRIDGLPYLPAAQGIAMFLGASYLYHRHWSRLRDFAAAAPLVIGEKGTRLNLDAVAKEGGIRLTLSTDLGSFSCTAEPGPFLGGPGPSPVPVEEEIPASRIYHAEGLFHGPSFQGIEKVSLGGGRAATVVDHDRLPPILDGGFWGRVVQWIDTAFQLVAVVELRETGAYCLPVGLGTVTPFFHVAPTNRIHLTLERFESGEGLISGEVRVCNERGECLLRLEEMRLKAVRLGAYRGRAKMAP